MDFTKQQEDWAIALRFYPDLTDIESRLNKIDPVLVPEFRSSLLASQQFERRQAVASQLEQSYLEDYFGDDPLIIDFARQLILCGNRGLARELNQMLKIVGNAVRPEDIIKEISKPKPDPLHELIIDAELGNISAQTRLGEIYEDGVGVDVDYNRATYWFVKAAEKGCEKARSRLGWEN